MVHADRAGMVVCMLKKLMQNLMQNGKKLQGDSGVTISAEDLINITFSRLITKFLDLIHVLHLYLTFFPPYDPDTPLPGRNLTK